MAKPDLDFSAEGVWKRIDKIVTKRFGGNYADFARKLNFSEPRIKTLCIGIQYQNLLLML